MNYYKVSFETKNGVYCVNIARAESTADVEREYSKYPWYNVAEATEYDAEAARRRGMPVVEITAGAEAEAEAEAEAPIDLRAAIIECLENMSTADLIAVHNNYCRAIEQEEDQLYYMCEFDEVMQGTDPLRLACKIFYGDFCPAHEFFWSNGYGNLMSADTFPTDEIKPICVSEIAEYIEREHDSLYDSDIQAILDDYDEEA